MTPDVYRVIGRRGEHEIKVKGSRFLGEAIPVVAEAEAEAAIEQIRTRAYTATHHCTAYRVGAETPIARYNDDGEPTGTAGLPILRQIEARDLTNTLVVVTRYYGGTKLGTGGLIRAYGEAASLVLDACSVEEKVVRVPVRLRFAYDDTSPAMHTLSQFDTEIAETRYSDATEIVALVRRSQARGFVEAFTNALGGRGLAERG